MAGERAWRASAALSLGLACATGLGLAFLVRHHTWDDAAITLGYSRTLAATGSIQFGRFGERVEGFSSLLWMLAGAALARHFADPERLLEAAQASCAVLYLLNAGLVFALARRCLRSRQRALAVAAAYSCLAAAIVSICDAMENHLFLTLHLALGLLVVAIADKPPTRTTLAALSLLPVALLACRPEGALTFAALLAWMGADRRRLPAATRVGLAAAVALAASLCIGVLLWRLWYFGAWLPNSVYAKMWPPYLLPFWTRVWTGARANGEFLLASVAWMLPLVPISTARPLSALAALAAAAREQALFATVLALFLLYHLGIGDPRGTSNRIWLALMPFALILAARALEALPQGQQPVRLAGAGLCFLLIQSHYYEEYRNAPITVAAVKRLHDPAARLAAFSPGGPLRLATPDVGAPFLFWGLEVELVDLALLNDTDGARLGWRGARTRLFTPRAPDVIATHEPWSTFNRFGSDPSRLEDYVNVSVDGRFYLVHERFLASLLGAESGVAVVRADQLPDSERARLKAQVFTDFPAGETGLPLRWKWRIDLPQ